MTNPQRAAAGRKGGSVRSARKAEAARRNGRRGGRRPLNTPPAGHEGRPGCPEPNATGLGHLRPSPIPSEGEGVEVSPERPAPIGESSRCPPPLAS